MTPEQHKTYDRLNSLGWEWSHNGEMDGHGVAKIHMQLRQHHAEFIRTVSTGVIDTMGRFIEDVFSDQAAQLAEDQADEHSERMKGINAHYES